MLSVSQFRKAFSSNGGIIGGRIIEKALKDTPDKQLFAQLLQNEEIRHFLVDLITRKIYEGSLIFKKETNQFIFGYTDFPPIQYKEDDLQMRK